ncbi:hypothetical protein CVT24_002931 [Panaeolus cyanescens]|uniref:CCHC-type domain-containing protein n=1 Tax=Panaeolus cyanescens TaxID=181874 RepID=A0A409VP26_9AGAR|nr:hypothetical protein CVT24_002931 [Panaeolus cyanescens]
MSHTPAEHWRYQPRSTNGRFIAASRTRSNTIVPEQPHTSEIEDSFDVSTLVDPDTPPSEPLDDIFPIHSSSTIDSGAHTPTSDIEPGPYLDTQPLVEPQHLEQEELSLNTQPATPQKRRYRKPMSSATLELTQFSGNESDKCQPSAFIKAFGREERRGCTNDAEIVTALADYLESDSPAEDWYNDPATPKSTWNALRASFIQRFPDAPKAKDTKEDLQRKLMDMRLEASKLGEKEMYMGTEVWSHVAFAQRVLRMAKEAGIDQNAGTIFTVRDHLPTVITDKVSSSHSSWTAFTDAIKNVDIEYIKDCARKRKEETERLKAEVKAQVSVSSHATSRQRHTTVAQVAQPIPDIAALQAQLNALSVTPNITSLTPPAAQLATRFPSSNPQARVPPSDDEVKAVQESIKKYPVQPNTPEGQQIYIQQLRQWITANGQDGRVTRSTGFPLRPGGAPAGSRECWNCGKMGHISSKCTLTGAQAVPEKERKFRSICATVLRSAQAVSVNQVSVLSDDDLAVWLSGGSVSGFQGNE